MVLDAYFLVVENEMHVEQIMQSHEENWVNKDFLIQVCFNFHKVSILKSVVIELNLIEVPLCVIKFINILSDVPLREVVLQEEPRKLEGLVISNWQDVVLMKRRVHHMLPDLAVSIFPEHHVVVHVENGGVIKKDTLINELLNPFVKGFVELGVSGVSDRIRVEHMGKVPRRKVRDLVDDGWLQMDEELFRSCHFVLLALRESSQDIGDIVHIQSPWNLHKLMDSILNPPPDVLKLNALEQVHSLCQSCDTLTVEVLGGFTEVMLIMGEQLFNITPIEVLESSSFVPWFIRGEGEHHIDEVIGPLLFFSFLHLAEEKLFSFDDCLLKFDVDICLTLVSMTLHDVMELLRSVNTLLNMIQSYFLKHIAQPRRSVFRSQLCERPLQLASMF